MVVGISLPVEMNNAGHKCAVCHEATTQICGGCRNVHYCNREHQNQHWNTHKLNCKPYKICSNPQLGRHMVASRDLKAGEFIFREKVAAFGPNNGSEPVCLSCFAIINKDNVCHCPGCNFPFCSQKCTKDPVHFEECKVLSRAKLRFTSADYGQEHTAYDCILPLRCLLLKESRPKDYENFRKLETHTNELRGSDLWYQNQRNVVYFLRYSCRMEQRFTEEEIDEACGAVIINAFDCFPFAIPIAGIFPAAASLMAHKCIANVDNRIYNKFWMITRASLPIKQGEIIFVCSTDPNLGTRERQRILRDWKFSGCNCVRCCDPTECQTYRSALKCQKCYEGYVLPMKPLDHYSDWKCNHCSHRLTSVDVDKIIDKLQKEYDAIGDQDVELFERFLKSHTSLLHPNHYFYNNARRSLNKIYCFHPQYQLKKLSPALLERKIDICKKLLSVEDILEPGLTRTRGLTLNELYGPILLLNRYRYFNGDHSLEEAKKWLLQAYNIIKESLSILSLHPADTFEGMMTTILKRTLQDAQEYILD